MLHSDDLKGELSETLREIKVEWKIADFFTLSQETGVSYQSPFFSFVRSRWNLQVFPGGDNTRDDTSWISVYVRGYSLDTPNSVTYTLGIMGEDGEITYVVEDKNHTFDENCPVSGLRKFYSTSELLKQKNALVPSGDLTIFCSLTDNRVKRNATTEVMPQPTKLTDLERLSTDFKNLLSCKRSCDATVKVLKKDFKVHKSILIARSPVFERLFEHDVSEKKIVISVADCDPDYFGEFLHYLYTGKAEIMTTRSALKLYRTADKYEVKELKSFCVRYMMCNLTVENMFDVAVLADEHEESALLSAIQVFFNRNVSRILSASGWDDFMTDYGYLANTLLKEMALKFKL